jgi:hypothetical protein
MALKLKLDTLDGLEDGVKALYVEKDGMFILDVEGVEDTKGLKTTLEKQREEAKELRKALGELKEQYKGIDIAAARKMLEDARTEEEKRLFKEGKGSEVYKARIAEYQKETENKLSEKDSVITKLRERTLKNNLKAMAASAGLHATAVDDAVARGLNIFTLDSDANVVRLGEDGEPVLGKDGKTPYSPTDWLEGMKETAPHWWPVDNSGGDNPGGGGRSPTKQIKDPVQRINAARGVKE